METVNLIIFVVCIGLVSADIKFDVLKHESSMQSRIAGGSNAQEGQFPYQVSLRLGAEMQHNCGASIISNRFLLTAAHCVDGKTSEPSYFSAFVGSVNLKDGVRLDIDKVIMNEGWNADKIINDIALLRTTEEIEFSDTIQPIALPSKDLPKEGNTPVVVSGWGLTNASRIPEILQYFELHTISLDECRKTYYANNFNEDIVCAVKGQGFSVCSADSGGPLVDISDPENKSLVGVVSFAAPCGEGKPDGFARVYPYLDWIHEKMEEHSTI